MNTDTTTTTDISDTTTTTDTTEPTTLLIAGHWLGAWAWDAVVGALRALGRRSLPLTLPGLDPRDPERASRTLDDQASAIVRTLLDAGAARSPAVVVAHSGANAPVSMVLDRRPDLVGHVVWVDSGPVAPGTVFLPDAPADLIDLPLPDFETLGGQASLDGLTATDLDRFRRLAVPEPGPVLTRPVPLSGDARQSVPTTLVCCSIPSAQVVEAAQGGHPMFAEVAALRQVGFVDLPTGHWPMWSRPTDLAAVIAGVDLA